MLDEIGVEIEQEIIEYRRDFHKYAEVAWTEFRTASLIASELKKLGYEIKLGPEVIKDEARMGLPSQEELASHYQRALQQGADKELVKHLKGGYTGVVGILQQGPGPTIGLRFDIDAVEIPEDKVANHRPAEEKFASVNDNVMHACGHDGHIAIGLGVAKTIIKLKEKLQGTVKLIFQPGEEGVRGAKSMVSAGVVDDLDYLYGLHIGVKAQESGHLICGTDGFLATSKFDAYFTGAPAHAGGAPEQGRNALLAAATAVTNLSAIPRHSQGVTRVNVGQLKAGTGRNVIPAKAYLAIETRGGSTKLNKYMKEYATEILENAAQMHQVALDIKPMGEAKSGTSDQELSKRVYKLAQASNDFSFVADKKLELGGSEDFSYLMNRVQARGGQATFMMLGSDLTGAHHTKEFDFNEQDLKRGVKLLVNLILDSLSK
ncbi:amidohydrolase [Halanaerobaculum tunisiense]